MKRTTTLLVMAAVTTVTIATLSATAFAWHPEGKITKKVQNITTGSILSDADDKNSAVAAKPGDELRYVIEVKNIAKPADKNYNDMVKTIVTDNLPAGVELVSNPAQRKVTVDLGRLKPGESKTTEFKVRVNATTADPITNTACFTGDSEVNDRPQNGCNPAVVTVTIPKKPEVPITPQTPKTPEIPTELPKTGAAENVFLAAIALGVLFYAISRYFVSKRDLSKTVS